MNFLKKIDWNLVITCLVVFIVAHVVYDMAIEDAVTKAKSKSKIEE